MIADAKRRIFTQTRCAGVEEDHLLRARFHFGRAMKNVGEAFVYWLAGSAPLTEFGLPAWFSFGFKTLALFGAALAILWVFVAIIRLGCALTDYQPDEASDPSEWHWRARMEGVGYPPALAQTPAHRERF